jgi:hypothetical protein
MHREEVILICMDVDDSEEELERDRKAWRAPEGGRRVHEASKATNEGDDGGVRVVLLTVFYFGPGV